MENSFKNPQLNNTCSCLMQRPNMYLSTFWIAISMQHWIHNAVSTMQCLVSFQVKMIKNFCNFVLHDTKPKPSMSETAVWFLLILWYFAKQPRKWGCCGTINHQLISSLKFWYVHQCNWLSLNYLLMKFVNYMALAL